MHRQAIVDAALRLSAIGILDKENALICGVSVAAIRHWRAGRRRVASGRAAARRITCPRCHARPMDESSYAYLLGLYLGDGHIVHGPRDVYVLAIACRAAAMRPGQSSERAIASTYTSRGPCTMCPSPR